MKNQEHRQRAQPNPATVYVSNLDHSCSNRKIQSDLTQIFSKFGQISSINVMRNIKFKKLFAFVAFTDPKNAEEAIDNLNNTYFGDTRIKVQMQRGSKIQNNANAVTCYRCQKIGHFAKECTEPIQRREKRRKSRSQDKQKQQERSHKKRGRSIEKKKRRSSSSSSSESSSSSVRRKDKSRSRSRSNSSSSSSSSR